MKYEKIKDIPRLQVLKDEDLIDDFWYVVIFHPDTENHFLVQHDGNKKEGRYCTKHYRNNFQQQRFGGPYDTGTVYLINQQDAIDSIISINSIAKPANELNYELY